ncbi:phage tail-like protein [Sphingomonas sp. BE123]|jgi:phage tail-like protein|uniref:phage tail protein n=1 Tax=unclassified Sphingomonas TaxID=196159 RepID=UPI0028581397|nr:phage tail protein [Sphingomonas sp. BE123]MDR6852884.1 phage tail-like protein [Sphingomonas sp. BE123]
MSAENTTWPLPKFYFSVTGIPGTPVFQEVTGLESEAQVIEYRAGNSAIFAPIKMPGLQKVGNVTMKKGIFVTDQTLWTWFSSIAMNTIARSTIVVNLLDETGAPRMMWTLNNAFPTKLSGTDLKSDGNEVAVESIEIAYETLKVSIA